MAITEQGALNDFYNMQPNISVEIVGNTAIFTAEINYQDLTKEEFEMYEENNDSCR